MRHVIPISGKDSLATAIVQSTHDPGEYEYFFNDTGTELPETYEWLDRIEEVMGIKIERVGKSLVDIIYREGMLPSFKARFCTRMSKIYPMVEYLGDEECKVYFGIRADEERAGFNNTIAPNLTPEYPLKDLGIDINSVYTILGNYDLLPPKFRWKRLESAVLGKTVVPDVPEWIYDQLFAGRTRTNCFHCFYQRRYEWAWLLDEHPDLFERAEEIENDHAGDRREEPYYWIGKDFPLDKIRKNFQRIFDRRVKDVVNKVEELRVPKLINLEKDGIDMAPTKSCGIFCGK